MRISEDKRLILQMQKNVPAAFNTLYWKYHADVYANVMKLVRDSDATADIVQETFISLWEKRNDIKPDAGIAGWLFVVSYNRAVSYLRKEVRKAERQQMMQLLELNSGEERLENVEGQWTALEEAVAQLSPQKRRVFEICKIQGKTYDQTAAEMGISKHTVKEYLSDAVASIKKYIRQHDVEYPFVISVVLAAAILV